MPGQAQRQLATWLALCQKLTFLQYLRVESDWTFNPFEHLNRKTLSHAVYIWLFILDRCKKNAHHVSYDRNCNNIIAIFQYYLLNITVWFLI